MSWMGDCIHVFTATDHQKNALKKTNRLVYHWLCIELHFNLNRRSYHLIWVYPKHEFFMLSGNHFLCFQHFSLSLFFFSQSAEIEVAHYTRVHTIWYINAGLLEKEKNRLFQASIHWGTVRSKIHYFFYWVMNIFFSVYRKRAWKVLFVLFWST